MVTRESMKKWIIECLQERGGSAWPREVSSMYGTATRLSLGIPAICCIRGNMTFVGSLNN